MKSSGNHDPAACRAGARVLLFVAALATATPGSAQHWISMSPSARGMGHAGVASITGPRALYWNPANIARDMDRDTLLGTVDGIADLRVEGDTLIKADHLADLVDQLDIDGIQDRFNAGIISDTDIRDVFRIVDGIADLTDPGSGVAADVAGSVGMQSRSWAVSYRYLSRIGLSPVVDFGSGAGLSLADEGLADLSAGLEGIVLARIAAGQPLNIPSTPEGGSLSRRLRDAGADLGLVISQAAGDEFAFQGEQALGSRFQDANLQQLLDGVLSATSLATGDDVELLADNQSGVVIKGISFHELSAGRAFHLQHVGNGLRLGIAARLLSGRTFLNRITFRELDDGSQLLDDVFSSFNRSTRTSVRATLDAGAAYDLNETLSAGLTARNLIPVEFPFSDGTDFDLEPQVRAGLALRPRSLPWLTVALDADITRNQTDALPGFESRLVGGGIQVASRLGPIDYALRAGGFANLAAEHIGPVVTLGLEIRCGAFFVGAEGHITIDSVDIEAASVTTDRADSPERVGASLVLGLRF